MRWRGVREVMGVGRGVEFLLGLKKLILRVLFSPSRCYVCEHKSGINEMRIFSLLEGDVRVMLCLQTKAVNVCC